MIVQCAACQTLFKIADEKVSDHGVKVRCRKCSSVFVVYKGTVPAPDSPPLGRMGFETPPAPVAAPTSAKPPLSPPAPTPGRPEAFRRFQTDELTGADPFLQHAKAAGSDPFAGPQAPAAAPDPGGDPFASYDLAFGQAQQQDVFGVPTVRRNVPQELARVCQDPPAGSARRLSPQQTPKVKLPVAPLQDPFAQLDWTGLGGPGPKTPLQAPEGEDPFRIPAPSSQPVSPAGAPPAPTPRNPPLPDPFLAVSSAPLELAPAAPPAAAGSMPAPLDLASIDLGLPEPASSDLAPEPQQPAGERASPARPEPEPEPPIAARPARGQGGKVEIKSPAAAEATRLPPSKAARRSRPGLVAPLLIALALLVVSGLVVERTALAIRSRGLAEAAPGAALAVSELGSSYYLTRDGRPVLLVWGKVTNRAAARAEPAVKVTVELRRGQAVDRSAEAFAGQAPGLEEIFSASGPLELSDVVQRAAGRAGPVEPKTTTDFLAVFAETDGMADLTLRATAVASAVPAAARPEPPAPAPAENEVAAPPDEQPGEQRGPQPGEQPGLQTDEQPGSLPGKESRRHQPPMGPRRTKAR